MSFPRITVAHYPFVSLQVFTGAVPFNDTVTTAAMMAIIAGERPPRPTHRQFTSRLWILMQGCWDQDPRLRPQVLEVLRMLRDQWALCFLDV